MNIFERLFRLIFPHLDEDERTEILRNLSDYEADLSCLENQYILSISYLFCAKNMSAILSFMRLQRSAATTDRTVPAASAALPSLLITR